jgi:hypothetical protein
MKTHFFAAICALGALSHSVLSAAEASDLTSRSSLTVPTKVTRYVLGDAQLDSVSAGDLRNALRIIAANGCEIGNQCIIMQPFAVISCSMSTMCTSNTTLPPRFTPDQLIQGSQPQIVPLTNEVSHWDDIQY